jgi:hypothetical protein
LAQIFLVFKNIQKSKYAAQAVDDHAGQGQVEKLFDDIQSAWSILIGHLKSDLIPGQEVFEFKSDIKTINSVYCSICCLNVGVMNLESSKNKQVNYQEAVIKVEQKQYHSTCANFWINCVNDQLPIILI